MAKMDLPPDFVFETDANNKLPPADTSDSERSNSTSDEETPDDAARIGKSFEEKNLKRKHNKVVTFANEPDHLKQQGDDDEEETEEQKYMRLRYKRSGSLPSIELNRELARKIRRMLKDEEQNPEDTLNQLTDSLKLSAEIDKSTSETKYEYEFSHGQILQVRLGDITEESVDVMVNEANSNLTHNGGIAGLISQKGGREVQHLSDRWIRKHGPVPPGHVAVTEAGQLPCKWLIHAVGPIWRGGNSGEDTELYDAMWNSLVWASKLQARTIAIPLIGAGFLGFQKERCSYLLVDCVSKFFRKFPKSPLQEIRIVNHNSVITESVVFEVVGKFTSGCDTSESERDYSVSDEEFDEEEEGEEFEEEEETEEVEEGATTTDNGDGTETSPKKSNNKPSIMNKSPKSVIKEHVDPSWIPMWRRQSIA